MSFCKSLLVYLIINNKFDVNMDNEMKALIKTPLFMPKCLMDG